MNCYICNNKVYCDSRYIECRFCNYTYSFNTQNIWITGTLCKIGKVKAVIYNGTYKKCVKAFKLKYFL